MVTLPASSWNHHFVSSLLLVGGGADPFCVNDSCKGLTKYAHDCLLWSCVVLVEENLCPILVGVPKKERELVGWWLYLFNLFRPSSGVHWLIQG